MNCVSQDAGYSHLKDRLTAATGLAFSAEREEALRKFISERLSALGMRDCGSYAGLLDDGGRGRAEMEVLISYLTIGETCFFRDQKQFDAIRDIILPDILARNQHSRQLRIWSAGCATGAEPYSLAILLLDEFADRIWGWQVAIDGTDLNRDFLDQAVEGKFRAWALRSLTAEMTRKCFSQDGLVWTIHPRYQQWVSFRQRNLAGSEFSMPLAGGANYDLILCRNVMIYFTSQARHRLVEQLYQSLGYGGWLVLGASEHSLQTYRGFRPVHADGAKLYQKNAPPLGPGALPLGPGEWGLREPEMAPAPAALSRSLPVPPTAAARRPADPFLKSRTGPGAPDLDGLRQLADRGEWQAAAEYGRKLLAGDQLNPAIHFYQALIFESLGSADQSERSLRQAIYLDRNFALAHYHLGLALKRGLKARAAARSFGNVLKVLAEAPDDALVEAGPGVTATELKELIRMHLESSSGL